MTAATVLLPLHPYPLNEGVRDHLRATLLLMQVPEGRETPLTLGSLQYLANDVGDNEGNSYGNNCRIKGERGGGGRRGSSGGRALFSLLGIRLFLELTAG